MEAPPKAPANELLQISVCSPAPTPPPPGARRWSQNPPRPPPPPPRRRIQPRWQAPQPAGAGRSDRTPGKREAGGRELVCGDRNGVLSKKPFTSDRSLSISRWTDEPARDFFAVIVVCL